jgi:c-di-GMP phosphodiesterase
VWRTIPRSRVTLGYFHEFGPQDEAAGRLMDIAAHGYPLALSGDLKLESLQLLEKATHTIKLDVTKYKPDQLEKKFAELRKLKPKILASNVDTYDDLEFCKSLQFDFYQGHFLSRPAETTKSRSTG